MGKYKDKDSGIVYEFLKEGDEKANKWIEFSSALKRIMLEKHYEEEELKRLKKDLEFYIGYYESKEHGRDE